MRPPLRPAFPPLAAMARILIVDDEEMDRLLSSTILRDAGHELLFAADGETALDLYARHDVDLVITDLAMPRVNGLRLIQELREMDPGVAIIAVTGVSPEHLPTAEDLGADQTFYKPLEPSALLETVDAVLKERQVDWDSIWGR